MSDNWRETGAGVAGEHRRKNRLSEHRWDTDRQQRHLSSLLGKGWSGHDIGKQFFHELPIYRFSQERNPAYSNNGRLQEFPCCASKEKAHSIRHIKAHQLASCPEPAAMFKISPLAQIAVNPRRDSAHRHARRHLFLLSS